LLLSAVPSVSPVSTSASFGFPLFYHVPFSLCFLLCLLFSHLSAVNSGPTFPLTPSMRRPFLERHTYSLPLPVTLVLSPYPFSLVGFFSSLIVPLGKHSSLVDFLLLTLTRHFEKSPDDPPLPDKCPPSPPTISPSTAFFLYGGLCSHRSIMTPSPSL